MTLTRPALHAALNGSVALVLAAGYLAIRAGRVALHRAAMVGAFILSTVFLSSYLEYHYRVGTTKFQGVGVFRAVYFPLLVSHTLLALLVVPLVLLTLTFALRGNIERHRRWARWTWPIWMYVAVTGVAIYFFLAYGQS